MSGKDSDSKTGEVVQEAEHHGIGYFSTRIMEQPVSPCPYCGAKRVVVMTYENHLEEPFTYTVEHADERDAVARGCFESYCGFRTPMDAAAHADMRAVQKDGYVYFDGELGLLQANAEKKPSANVAYLCDGDACQRTKESGCGTLCHHTTRLDHAVNFKELDEPGKYMEEIF